MPNSAARALPEVVAELVEVAGVDAAWAIVRAKGGQTVFIPAHAKEDHWLALLVGLDVATKICDYFRVSNNGSKLLIPMAAAAQRATRWADVDSEARVNDTAAAMGVHRRTVFRHRRKKDRSKDRSNGSQGSLI